MSLGFFIVFILGAGAALGLCVSYLIRQRRVGNASHRSDPWRTPPISGAGSSAEFPEEKGSPFADRGFADIEIPRVPMYQETREPMTALRSKLDQFNAILEDILVAGGTPFRPTTAAIESFGQELPRLENVLLDARSQAKAILDKVENRPPSAEPVADSALENQPITISPSPRREPIEAYMARTLALLRETVNDAKPCIAGFYYALTKHEEQSRMAEASTQMALLILSLDSSLTRIAELERTLKRHTPDRLSARPGASG